MISIINKNRKKRSVGLSREERVKRWELGRAADQKEIELWQNIAKELSELRKIDLNART